MAAPLRSTEPSPSSDVVEKPCDRCGARLGRGTIRINVAAQDEDEPDASPALDVCRQCGDSLSRWLSRGRDRHQASRKPRPPGPRKRSSVRERVRTRRAMMAFGVASFVFLIFAYLAWIVKPYLM